MTHTSIFGQPSLRTLALAATLLGATLLGNVALAEEATTSVSNTAKTAVHKTERVMSDSWITTKVKSEILANSVSKAFKVAVKTRHGVVTLGGKLPSQDAIDLVTLTAEKVTGVKRVDNAGLSIGS